MSGGGTQMTNHSRRGRPTQPNRTAIATASDSVQTPKAVAKWVVEYFAPRGRILEPARGDGNFLCFLPRETEWCEIKSGRDFFQYDGHVDWILTNPPYSIYDLFLNKCFAVAENIVFVCPVAKALKSQKSDRILSNYGGIREIVLMGGGQSLGFAFGFLSGCIHFQREYHGPITLSRMYDWKV